MSLDIKEAGGRDAVMKYAQRIAMMIAEMYASGYNGNKSMR